MRSDYKRLGDYIREVDVRNRDLAVTNLLGVSITKEFIPSIANTIGTDMSSYKVVRRGQFAYGPVTSRNGDKVSIAILKEDEAIISQAYCVFEVRDENELLPEYLMMWFRRPEFDRYARFKSHGSAREIFDWAEMCEVRLPIPSISRQRELVTRYETLTRRICLNETLITDLEVTAQTLYRHLFVDNIDPSHLPAGWRMGTIGEFCEEMKSGGTPSRLNNSYWDSKDYPWLKTGEVHNNIILGTEEYISQRGLEKSSAKLIPAGSVVMAMYGATAAQVGYLDCETTTNQACCNMTCKTKADATYLFFHLIYNQEEIKRMANGGAQENLSQEMISNLPILFPKTTNEEQKFVPLLDQLRLLYKENALLSEMQSLLLTKLVK